VIFEAKGFNGKCEVTLHKPRELENQDYEGYFGGIPKTKMLAMLNFVG